MSENHDFVLVKSQLETLFKIVNLAKLGQSQLIKNKITNFINFKFKFLL